VAFVLCRAACRRVSVRRVQGLGGRVG